MEILYENLSSKRKSEKPILDKLRDKHHAFSNGAGRRRAIKFSDYTDIRIENECLHIRIDHKKSGKDLKNPVAENMQTDGAAFEGWAICLKSWLPDEINRVSLTWDKPEKNTGHYNRFLYRVWKFKEMYDWFSMKILQET